MRSSEIAARKQPAAEASVAPLAAPEVRSGACDMFPAKLLRGTVPEVCNYKNSNRFNARTTPDLEILADSAEERGLLLPW